MAANDLTSIESYREYSAVSGAAATALEDRIASIITVASEAIMQFCQQEFAPVTASAARQFEYRGGGVLSLAPYSLRSVTSVEIDTDTDSPTTLEATQYRLAPLPARNGVYTTLHMIGVGVQPALVEQSPSLRVVTVTGAWGYAAVPGPVREACNMTVGYILRTMSQHQGDEFDSGSAGWGGSAVLLPGNAKRLLAPYRRYATGI